MNEDSKLEKERKQEGKEGSIRLLLCTVTRGHRSCSKLRKSIEARQQSPTPLSHRIRISSNPRGRAAASKTPSISGNGDLRRSRPQAACRSVQEVEGF